MSNKFWGQFKAILGKNIRISLRSRALLRQIINLLIMFAVVVVLQKTGGSQSSQQLVPVYMSIAIMLFCRGVALSWVSEKQTRQAELQQSMGAATVPYFAAWLTFFVLNGAFLSLLFIGLLSAVGVLGGGGLTVGTAIWLYLLFMLASLSFVLFLSSLFSDALLASQAITFVQLLGSMLYFLLYLKSFRSSSFGIHFTSLLPSLCFEYTLMTLGISDGKPAFSTPFTSVQGYITLGSLAVGYFIIFLYLQQVIPSSGGTGKHPFFCFLCPKRASPLEEKMELGQLSSARFCQQQRQYKKISLHMSGLSKSYDNHPVVQNLALSLFSGEVFCLLGHNGAGKTTTISMLTGLLKPDSGNIRVLGMDYYTEQQKIRPRTGVCLQSNVLYDHLTAREHLQFYAALKGVQPQETGRQVDLLIKKCGLEDQQNKKSNELSGGNKRKVCLACAAIGDADLLFLDQPSSGLDPNSRRIVWGLIQDLRAAGKTVVLTTHHLEEAEVLADRVGILAHGELLIVGSCRYIKERFGCGYVLSIDLNKQISIEQQRSNICAAVSSIVARTRQDEQAGDSSLRFFLPLDQQQHYGKLFAYLEEKKYHFSLSLSSLEDIFIRVGVDPEALLANKPAAPIQQLHLPNIQSKYSFSQQWSVVWVKKWQTTMRSFSVFTSIFLPVIFIVIGVVISMQAFSSPGNPEEVALFAWTKFYTIAYFMALAFSFNTASYCGSIVRERQIRFKYLSGVMGLRRNAYWLATATFDLLMLTLPLAVLFITIACFPSSKSQDLVNAFGWIGLSLVLFCFCFLNFTYVWSFAFDSARTAYRFYPFLVFLLFFIIPTIPIYVIPTNPIIRYVLPIVSPLVGLTSAMLSQQMLGSSNYAIITSQSIQLFTQPTIWYPLGILAIQTIIFMTLVLILDRLQLTLKDRQEINAHQLSLAKSEDVRKQEALIAENRYQKVPVIVEGLYKKYPNGYLAIRDNSFLLSEGQTFGLLGPNGAGKSTTFALLTAALSKTLGTVELRGEPVDQAAAQLFSGVGVCPQFDPLYDELTVEEHLKFFAGVKGIEKGQIEQIISFYLKNLQLEEYRNIKSHKLSGGSKRKLCVAMALIGSPNLLFLDEPSAGVDPLARRHLWTLLHGRRKGKGASVLTTHSINEAESLCDRIGILIKGEFYCIGSPADLKQRYGRGYRGTLRCDSRQKAKQAIATVKAAFPNSKQQILPDQLKLSFEFQKEGFIFSQAFELLYNKLTVGKVITQFDLAETTLEEVFIHLSQLQGDQEVRSIQEQCCSCIC